VFENQLGPLREVPPDEFQRRFNAFRKQQMSAAQRRAFTGSLLEDLASVTGGDGSAAAFVPGLTTRDSGQPGDPSFLVDLPELDLSAGVVEPGAVAMVDQSLSG